MYRIKDLKILNLHPLLREVVGWVTAKHGYDIITSAHRPDDPGVHGTIPVRGIDLRIFNVGIAQLIANAINRRWIYDSERPGKKVAIVHDVGSGWHLHLQVHPNTAKR